MTSCFRRCCAMLKRCKISFNGLLPSALFTPASVCTDGAQRFDAPWLSLHMPYLFCSNRCGIASRTYFFLACQKKVCKKETLGYEIALTRLKNKSFRSAFCRFVPVV